MGTQIAVVGATSWVGRRVSNCVLFARRRPMGAASAVVILLLIVIATSANVVAPHPPNEQSFASRYAPPSSTLPLGGDEFGRDILSRLIVGTRISLVVGLSATGLAAVVGLGIGIASGYFGGWIDLLTQRMIDVLQAFPGLILAMVFVVALGPSLMSVIIAIAVPSLPGSTRITRSVTLQIKELDYVSAARAIGSNHVGAMWRHVLPQTIAPFIIVFSIGIGQAIVTEATLGFIGLSIPPPTATWGSMLSQAVKAFFLAPWVAIFPGLALSVTVFAVNLFGDAIRDHLDPRLKGLGRT